MVLMEVPCRIVLVFKEINWITLFWVSGCLLGSRLGHTTGTQGQFLALHSGTTVGRLGGDHSFYTYVVGNPAWVSYVQGKHPLPAALLPWPLLMISKLNQSRDGGFPTLAVQTKQSRTACVDTNKVAEHNESGDNPGNTALRSMNSCHRYHIRQTELISPCFRRAGVQNQTQNTKKARINARVAKLKYLR